MSGYKTFDLGLVDYAKACAFQKSVFERVRAGEFNAALIFCRHYPVITLGRGADKKNIVAGQEELKNTGIGLYNIERGGDVTYHGPGQVTVYPIMDLNYLKKDIHWFLRRLEDVIIGAISGFGVAAGRRQGLTGVWLGKKKISSIGIAVRHWISFHGLSVNIEKKDLTNFNFIRPCGLDVEMTSLESALGRRVSLGAFKKGLLNEFGLLFS